jgi:hypothetical protein
MDHQFLIIICAGVLLLVTALALATPGLRNDDSSKERGYRAGTTA